MVDGHQTISTWKEFTDSVRKEFSRVNAEEIAATDWGADTEDDVFLVMPTSPETETELTTQGVNPTVDLITEDGAAFHGKRILQQLLKKETILGFVSTSRLTKGHRITPMTYATIRKILQEDPDSL